jgi:hypothetical protein
MRKIIKYFTPVGVDEKDFARTFVIVIAIILVLVFLFPILSLTL